MLLYQCKLYHEQEEELLLLFDKLDSDIIGISESWCEESVLDGEVHLHRYNLFREDNTLTAKRET